MKETISRDAVHHPLGDSFTGQMSVQHHMLGEHEQHPDEEKEPYKDDEKQSSWRRGIVIVVVVFVVSMPSVVAAARLKQ